MYRDSCHVIARPFTQLRIVTDAKISGNRRSRHAISTRHLRIVAPRKQKESKPTVSRFFPPVCFGQKLTCRERCLPVNCRSHEPVLLRSRPIFATRLRSLHAGKKKRKKCSDPVISGTGKQSPFGPTARSLGRIQARKKEKDYIPRDV